MMNWSAKDGARSSPALWGAKAFPSTHRIKVCADGTVRKNHT